MKTTYQKDGSRLIDPGAVTLRREFDMPSGRRGRDPLQVDDWQVRLAVAPHRPQELRILGYRPASDIHPDLGWTSASDFRWLFPKLAEELHSLAREWFIENREAFALSEVSAA